MASGGIGPRAAMLALTSPADVTVKMSWRRPLGSSADGKAEEGIDRCLERAGAPLYLGEEKPSLERGEQGDGEVIRVEAGRELAAGRRNPSPSLISAVHRWNPAAIRDRASGSLSASRPPSEPRGKPSFAWTRSAT